MVVAVVRRAPRRYSCTWHQASDRFCETTRESRSILLPSTTNGKLSGSRGPAWMRNSSLHLVRGLGAGVRVGVRVRVRPG